MANPVAMCKQNMNVGKDIFIEELSAQHYHYRYARALEFLVGNLLHFWEGDIKKYIKYKKMCTCTWAHLQLVHTQVLRLSRLLKFIVGN